MINGFNPVSKLNSTHIFSIIFALVLAFGVIGCSSDDEEEKEPLPDQDASGLFKDGTAQLDGGTVMLSDIRGFVHDGRIMMFSIEGHVLFDGQVTGLESDTYQATVDVYENGVKTQSDVSVTGNVLTDSKITGNINGTGKASGDFTLTFDPLYGRGATSERIETEGINKWKGIYHSVSDVNGDIPFRGDGTFGGTTHAIPVCLVKEGIVTMPSDQINIYQLSHTIIDLLECNFIGNNYTGFGAVVDGEFTDDTLLYAVTNGEFSIFSYMTKDPD